MGQQYALIVVQHKATTEYNG